MTLFYLHITIHRNLAWNRKSSMMLIFLKTHSTFRMLKLFFTVEPLNTILFTKPKVSHLYLNYNFCHPSHIIRNIPKGQFIRIRRTCSEKNHYGYHSNNMIKPFLAGDNDEKRVRNSVKDILKVLRKYVPRIIRVWSLFCSIRVYKGLHFLPVLLEN